MTNKIPKFPESLPPFCEMTRCPREHHLTVGDLDGKVNLQNLIHDLYWFDDDLYYLYFRHGEGIGKNFVANIEKEGIEIKKTELYFYRHPKAAYKNDFIRVLPHEKVPQWQKDAAKSQMFGRVLIALEPSTRKQIDFKVNAHITSSVITDNEPLVEVKPNIFGIGVNFNSMWRKAFNWLRQK